MTRGEEELLNYLTKLYNEGAKAREKWSKEWDSALRTIRGKTWPTRRPKYKIDAVMNFLGQIVEKKTALLTDSRPTFDIVSRHKGLDDVCAMLKKVCEAIDEERSWEQKLTELVILEQLFGIAFVNTCFDRSLDWGRGDIDVVVLDPRTCVFDPFVLRTYNLEHAEYFVLETVRPTDYLRELFPKRADEIKADFTTDTQHRSDSVLSKIRSLFAGLATNEDSTALTSVVPRSIVRDYWIRDRRTKEVIVTPEGREEARLKYPNWREIVVAGGCIVEDGANPYIDGRLPFDAMEWDFNVDSAYGFNEISKLEMPQILFNKVLATIVENAILLGNGIWIGDYNALPDEKWEELSNEPGSFVRIRPGTNLRRESGPPLPAYIPNILSHLLVGLEKLSSVTEATEGRRPGQVCVDVETECLTNRGWKKYHELRSGDLLYTFNPQTEQGEWSPLIGVATYDWDDYLISIETKRLSCLVTPNHGWLVGSTNETHAKQAHYLNSHLQWSTRYRRVETKDLNSSHYIPNSFSLTHPSPAPYSDAFLTFLGWLFSDGCYSITNRPNGSSRYRIILSQSAKANPLKCAEILDCLNSLGIPYTTHKDKRNDLVSYTIEGQFAHQIISLFPDKRPGYPFISSLSARQLRLLRDAMLKGDSDDGTYFFTVDRELANQFQMIAVLSGGAGTHLTTTKSSSPNHRYSNTNIVTCRSDSAIHWRSLLPHKRLIHYKGIVWCPQTLTGTWLARRNGITYLTHNTSGVAIEALQMAASTAIRLKARQLESLQQRIGQKKIARIFQYYTEDRVFNLLGDDGKFHKYVFERQRLREALDRAGIKITEAFKDFRYKIVPSSSLAITKWQKGLIAMQLHGAGIIDGEEVLRTIEWPNWEEVHARTKEKQGAGFEGPPSRPQKLPRSLLRGGHRETGLQEPQIGK